MVFAKCNRRLVRIEMSRSWTRFNYFQTPFQLTASETTWSLSDSIIFNRTDDICPVWWSIRFPYSSRPRKKPISMTRRTWSLNRSLRLRRRALVSSFFSWVSRKMLRFESSSKRYLKKFKLIKIVLLKITQNTPDLSIQLRVLLNHASQSNAPISACWQF